MNAPTFEQDKTNTVRAIVLSAVAGLAFYALIFGMVVFL